MAEVVDRGQLMDAADAAGDFFFQAEDGIRDDLVTGVQTCALPILEVRGDVRQLVQRREYRIHSISLVAFVNFQGFQHVDEDFQGPYIPAACEAPERSEERRVGKECRSRWSPYH